MSTAPGRKASRRQEALGPLGGGARVLAENQLAGSVELQTQPALQIELRAQDLLQRRDFSMASAERLLLSLPASSGPGARPTQSAARKGGFRMTFGLYAHGHFSGLTNLTFKLPLLCRYLNAWLRSWCPAEAQWSSLNTLFNIESKPHKDVHNLKGRPNYVVTFGEHRQGELRGEDTFGLSDSGDLRRRQKSDGALVNAHLGRPRRKVVSFLPHQWHATMPWTGVPE